MVEYTELEGTQQDHLTQQEPNSRSLMLLHIMSKKNSRQGKVQNRIDCSESERGKLKRDSEGRFKIR